MGCLLNRGRRIFRRPTVLGFGLGLVAATLANAQTTWPLHATGQDSRIDLTWTAAKLDDADGFQIYRSAQSNGPFSLLTTKPHHPTVFSDFLGKNNQTFHYRIVALRRGAPTSTSAVATATSRAMTDEELVESVQRATFRYFWDYGHPISGLARERKGSRDTCTSGGTGFGLMAIVVGAERVWIQRDDAALRLLKMVRFLEDKATRYHGAWSHWLNGRTGRIIPFSKYDDGADLVETSYLVQGLLTVRQYFNRENAVERDLRERCTRLWREVEWDWFLREPNNRRLFWHWSPNFGWQMNHPIGGHFNECMITYLLAIASPTHPIPPECYYQGWTGDPPTGYVNGRTYYGFKQWVGWPMGGPLFFTHYSFLGFDPRHWRDRYCNYFENNRNICRIQRAYCADNPKQHRGYSELTWGLTASDTPGGYLAHEPRRDTGTITPTAALSAMPYVPQESLATLKYFYHQDGRQLWGEFGFKDAFNLDKDWFADSYLAIDQGPTIIMIENHRTGLCWRLFMANEEIPRALKAVGWIKEP